MTNQLEATLGVLRDVSADAVGSLHHGFEVLGETVTDTVGQVFGQDPPPSHKSRWAGVVLCVGAVILVLVVLRNRRAALEDTRPTPETTDEDDVTRSAAVPPRP